MCSKVAFGAPSTRCSRFVPLCATASPFLCAHLTAAASGRGPKVICGVAGDKREDVIAVAEMAERGALRPIIDSVYAFDDIAAAHARVDTGRKRGSVVVDVVAPAS